MSCKDFQPRSDSRPTARQSPSKQRGIRRQPAAGRKPPRADAASVLPSSRVGSLPPAASPESGLAPDADGAASEKSTRVQRSEGSVTRPRLYGLLPTRTERTGLRVYPRDRTLSTTRNGLRPRPRCWTIDLAVDRWEFTTNPALAPTNPPSSPAGSRTSDRPCGAAASPHATCTGPDPCRRGSG